MATGTHVSDIGKIRVQTMFMEYDNTKQNLINV